MHKIICGCLLIGTVTIGIFCLAHLLAWPWWGGIALCCALAGGVLLLIFAQRFFRRRREQRFIERVITHDRRLIEQAHEEERHQLHALQQRWTEAITTLRQSRLRHQGNPLYVLPWYLMLGAPHAGKSSAIARSGLLSIHSPVGPIPGDSTTRNCDWWFFEQSIVIDTAGRYTLPLQEAADEREWGTFLTLLAQYRRREPLNGIVVALPAELLLPSQLEKLHDYGRYIGYRLHHLSQCLGARIPLYLVVTKADQIPSFVAYADTLSASERCQLLGYTIPHPTQAPPVMEQVVANIEQQLQRVLLQKSPPCSHHILLFTATLHQLIEPLHHFAKAAFHHDRYHEPVMLRGLYFTSAYQPREDGEAGHNMLYSENRTDTPKQSEQGLFLYDLFARLMPADRTLYKPLQEFLHWRTFTNQLTLLAVLLLSFSTIALLGVSYIDSQSQIHLLRQRVNDSKTAQGAVEQEILTLTALRQTIERCEKGHKKWYPLQLALRKPVATALNRARNHFVNHFSTQILNPLQQHLLNQLKQLDSQPPPPVLIGDAAVHLSWLLERLKAAPMATKRSTENEYGWIVAKPELIGVAIEYQPALSHLYRAFIAWQRDTQQLYALATTTREALNGLLTTQSDWSWIVAWASDPSRAPAIKAATFWQFPTQEQTAIPGAYTTQGRRIIEKLLQQLQDNSQSIDFDAQRHRFWNHYALQYQQTWYRFLHHFPATAAQLKVSERCLVAQTLTTADNPFFVLQRLAEVELMAIADLLPLDLFPLQFANRIIATQIVQNKRGPRRLLQQGEQLLSDMVNERHIPDYGERVTRGIKLYEQLQQSITTLLPSLQSKEHAAQKVATLLSDSSNDSTALQGWEAATELKQLMCTAQAQGVDTELFLSLYRFLLETQFALAAQYLQSQWEATVYGALRYIPTEQHNQRLFSEGGLLTKFMDGPMRPFITRQADGWHPVHYQGLSVPLHARFFAFIEQGMRSIQQSRTEYTVTLQAGTVEVNSETTEKPFAATLTLQRADGPQRFTHYNFPASTHFTWQPQICSDVTLEIHWHDLQLRKSWPGTFGLPHFLADLQQGTLYLTHHDFPQQQAQLQNKGCQWISIHYQVNGHSALLQYQTTNPLQVPLSIITLHEVPQ